MATRSPNHHAVVDSIQKALGKASSGEVSLDSEALAKLQKELEAVPLKEAKRALLDVIATAKVVGKLPQGKKVAADLLLMAHRVAQFQLDALKAFTVDESEKRIATVQKRFKHILGD